MNKDIDDMMSRVPENWRYRWCDGSWCACMGAANCSGGLSRFGFTKEDWQEWVERNPNPNPEGVPDYKKFTQLIVDMDKAQ